MNRLERLKAEYEDEVRFVYKSNIVKELKGLCVRNVIFINSNRNKTNVDTYETVAEEVGHYLTGVGCIVEEKTISERKQEAKARRWGRTRIVSLDDLITCSERGVHSPHEIAEELEVSELCVEEALDTYRSTKGLHFHHNGYCFKFNNDTNLEILKLSE